MNNQSLEFHSAAGHKLAARFDAPQGTVRAHALFAHCFSCSKDVLAASRIAKALTGYGIAVLRFDFTGLGASEGDFADTNFSSNVADLVAAADFLRQRQQAPSLLIGHSLGGAAVLEAAASIPEARAVVSIGAPSDPAHVAALFGTHLQAITEQGQAEVELAGRPFTIKRQWLEDAEGHNLRASTAQLRRAVMVMHAPGDSTVDIGNANALFTAAQHPKSFVSLDGADHLLTRREDGLWVAKMIAAWAERYVGQA